MWKTNNTISYKPLCLYYFLDIHPQKYIYFYFWYFNTTFSNISAISRRPVLVVEEAGVPRENNRPWASNW